MTRLLKQFQIPIGFGGASISGNQGGYGFGDCTEEKALNLLREAYDKGIQVYDTAPVYGFGDSEKRIGKAFKDVREDVFFISKSGVTWGPNQRVDMTNDPKVTKKMLEQSLKDLNTEYIDLYMIHWPDEKVDIRLPMEILSRALNEEKINHIGLCNTTPNDLMKAMEVAPIAAVQAEYNIFERKNSELFPMLDELDISFMSWGTLDKGIISGTVKKDSTFDKSDCRSWAPWWKKSNKDQKIKIMVEVLDFLKSKGHTGLELAMGYNLSKPNIDMVLCGAKNSDQLSGILKAFNNLPDIEVLEDAMEIIFNG